MAEERHKNFMLYLEHLKKNNHQPKKSTFSKNSVKIDHQFIDLKQRLGNPTNESLYGILSTIKDEGIDNFEYLYLCFKFIIDNNLEAQVAIEFPYFNYLFKKYCKGNCNESVREDSLYYLRWSYESGAPVTTQTTLLAAQLGHLKCLKYLLSINCPWTRIACRQAARYGHLNCLIALNEDDFKWDETTPEYAAENGHLHCLKYAIEEGCPYDENVCAYAAAGGQLECLKYAHERRLPWTDTTMKYALDNDHFDCFKYGYENNCPLSAEDKERLVEHGWVIY